MFLLLYFILYCSSLCPYTYCYRGNAVCHCFKKPLSIYLSIYFVGNEVELSPRFNDFDRVRSGNV